MGAEITRKWNSDTFLFHVLFVAMAKFRENFLKTQVNSFESEEEEESSSSSNEINEELLKLKRVPNEDDPLFEDAFPCKKMDSKYELSKSHR